MNTPRSTLVLLIALAALGPLPAMAAKAKNMPIPCVALVQATALEWSPSNRVRKELERDPALKDLLQSAPSEIVHVDLVFPQDPHRSRSADSHFPVLPMSKWWNDWIVAQFADNPAAVQNYQLAIRYLDAMYGPDLLIALSRGLEIVKPESGSILYGVFGIRGTFRALAETLDLLPEAGVSPPSWRPPPRSYVPLPPKGP